MLSKLVITFLPRSKCLLISWLQSPAAVILEPKKIKPDIVSTVSQSISHEVMGLYTLLYLKEIKKKDLLNSTANSPQYSLTTYMGKEPKKDAFYNVLLLSAIQ